MSIWIQSALQELSLRQNICSLKCLPQRNWKPYSQIRLWISMAKIPGISHSVPMSESLAELCIYHKRHWHVFLSVAIKQTWALLSISLVLSTVIFGLKLGNLEQLGMCNSNTLTRNYFSYYSINYIICFVYVSTKCFRQRVSKRSLNVCGNTN